MEDGERERKKRVEERLEMEKKWKEGERWLVYPEGHSDRVIKYVAER